MMSNDLTSFYVCFCFTFCFFSYQRDDGECGPIQRAGILPSPQTPEHQESGEMVPHLER